MFSSLFYYESEQTRICNHIDKILDKNLTENIITMDMIPSGFGKEFIIGSEIENTDRFEGDESRYYIIHFIDEIEDPIRCMRGKDDGVLQVTKQGKLNILDEHLKLKNVSSSFVFENGMLELHANGWLAHRQQQQHQSRFCNIV